MNKKRLDMIMMTLAIVGIISVLTVGVIKAFVKRGTGTAFMAMEQLDSKDPKQTKRTSNSSNSKFDESDIAVKETPSEKDDNDKTEHDQINDKKKSKLGENSDKVSAAGKSKTTIRKEDKNSTETIPVKMTANPSKETISSKPREKTVNSTETEIIYFETVYQYTDQLPEGVEEVLQWGANGLKNVSYKHSYQDDVLVSSEEVSSTIVEEPSEYIILVGTTDQGLLVPQQQEMMSAVAPEETPIEAIQVEALAVAVAAHAEANKVEEPNEQPDEKVSETVEVLPSEVTEPVEETTVEQIEETTWVSQTESSNVDSQPNYTDFGNHLDNLISSPIADGFAKPGSATAAKTNFDIVASLFNYNGIMTYNTFSDNKDGTITVDGNTFEVQKGPTNMNTTYYDGYECAKITGIENAQFSFNGYACNGTATGIMAQRGIVATSMQGNGLPYGTVVFVEGYGLAVVADVGNFDNTMLDLCVNAGEIAENGSAFFTSGRNVYIISIP